MNTDLLRPGKMTALDCATTEPRESRKPEEHWLVISVVAGRH